MPLQTPIAHPSPLPSRQAPGDALKTRHVTTTSPEALPPTPPRSAIRATLAQATLLTLAYIALKTLT